MGGAAIFSDLVQGIDATGNWLIAGNLAASLCLVGAFLRYRRARLMIASERQNNAELIENLSEGVYRSTIDGRQISANAALVRLNGYASEAEQLAGVHDIGLEWYVDPKRRDEFRAILARDGRVENFISEIYRHKTRERIWISESARIVCDRVTGRALYYEGSVREVTETVKRLDVEEEFRKLTVRLPVGLFHFVGRSDGVFECLFLSDAASRVSGIPIAEQMSNPEIFSELVHEDDRSAYFDGFQASLRNIAPWDCEFRIHSRDGIEKWVRINAHTEAVGSDIHWYGYISDISVRKRQEMEIQRLAYFDALTKLPNRRMFLDRIGETLEQCDLSGGSASLLFIDLDNFKNLNDTRGHDVGDHLLIKVADRIRQCISSQDLAARMGGDEFVVIISPNGTDRSLATLRAISTGNRILSEMQNGFELDGERFTGSASIGIVVFDGKQKRGDEILKCADIAMYQAKAAGRNGLSLYDPEMSDRLQRTA